MAASPPQEAGLCGRCAHARRVETPRSRFWLCELALGDARFARYPRLPVLECTGFAALPEGETPPGKPPGRGSQE